MVSCVVLNSAWDEHDVFDIDQLPFFIEMFPVVLRGVTYIGLDLRLQVPGCTGLFSVQRYFTVAVH